MTSPAYDLSFIVPARNEFYRELDLLGHTVQNLLANTARSNVIVILDGYDSGWPPKPLPVDPRVTVIHHNQSIGQRAACNEGVRASTAKFICKIDAHCAVDRDFDVKMMAHCDYETTLIGVQYNLHAFSWRCKKCASETYQGPRPTKCEKCGSRYTRQVVKWEPRGWRERNGVWEGRPKTTNWRFDSTLHFQYDHNRTPAEGEVLTETMSCLGACWMLQRERYWELDGMDEQYGSWGNMGTELACKSWLSGGKMLVNHLTWFAHLFRTQPNFGFPYPNPGADKARTRSRKIWMNNLWPKQVYPLSWLIEKFAPVRDWNTVENNPVLAQVKAEGEKFYGRQPQPTTKPSKPSVGIVYYTCSTLADPLATAARNQLLRAKNGHELGCVSLARTDFGDWNIVVNAERGPLTMHRQILAGLERLKSDIVFFCEHDVLYSPSHFEFTPPDKTTFWYNVNVWRVRASDGHAVKTADCKQLSGLCCWRELAVSHYRERVRRIELEGFSRRNGYEPGTRHLPHGFDNAPAESWSSAFPNLDIRHNGTATGNHWTPESFRNKKYAAGWEETDDVIPGWPKLAGRMDEVLKELANGLH